MHVESPSNPLMKITDLEALSDELRHRGILLLRRCNDDDAFDDETLDLGVDIVCHSGTKFFRPFRHDGRAGPHEWIQK